MESRSWLLDKDSWGVVTKKLSIRNLLTLSQVSKKLNEICQKTLDLYETELCQQCEFFISAIKGNLIVKSDMYVKAEKLICSFDSLILGRLTKSIESKKTYETQCLLLLQKLRDANKESNKTPSLFASSAAIKVKNAFILSHLNIAIEQLKQMCENREQEKIKIIIKHFSDCLEAFKNYHQALSASVMDPVKDQTLIKRSFTD